MKYILLFSIIIVNIQLKAQTISGNIYDIQHQAIPFAPVLLLQKGDSAMVKGTLSNEQGKYNFEGIKAGSYLLSISMTGYKKMYTEVNVFQDITKDLSLDPQSQQLQAVDIIAVKSLIEQQMDRTTLNLENSILAAGNNAMEILKIAPLITMDHTGGIHLKGKTNVLVMMDGKILPAETVDNILTSLPAEQIVKIELITSPSAKYDAAAVGGIINIITKKNSATGLNGTANIGASQSAYSRYNGGLSLNYRQNKLNIYSMFSGRQGRSYKNEELTRELQNNNTAVSLRTPTELFANRNSVTGKVGVDYNINKNNVVGGAVDVLFASSDNRAVSNNYFGEKEGVADSIYTTHSRPGGSVGYAAYNLNYQGQRFSADLTYMHYNDMTRQHLVTDKNTSDGQVISTTRTKANYNLLTFQIDHNLPLTSTAKLESGFKMVRTRSVNHSTVQNDSVSLNNTQYKEDILAGYVNISQQWKTLKLQAGLRAEHTVAILSTAFVRNHYLDIFPNVTLSQHFSDNYQMGISWTNRINRPAYESLIPFVIAIDTYTQETGNADLKPEYAHSFDFTNTYKEISLTLNYTFTRNAITDFVFENAATKVWTFTKGNFSRLNSYSASLFLPFAIGKWWTSNNTLLGIHNTFSNGDIGGAYFSQGKYSFNFNSINSFVLPGGFKAEITGSYTGAAVYGIYSISAYSQVNVGISRSFLSGKLDVKVGMNDIFHDAGYGLSMNANVLKSYGYSRYDSRRGVVSVYYKFGKKVMPARERSGATETEQGRLNL